MTTCIALIRGINLAGARRMSMADLKAMLVSLKLKEPRTLLQSGNLVFIDPTRTPEQLESLLEKETEKRLGMKSEYFVRTAEEWKEMVAKNPFTDEAKRDPGHLILHVLKGPVTVAQVKTLQGAIAGREVAKHGSRHVYLTYPDGAGSSKLTSVILDRHLGRGTARNWNTVLKLLAMTA
jgi:uncharacterized protein (DUF1697 family)